jgi:hypothetical protein
VAPLADDDALMDTTDTLVPRLLACGVNPSDIRGCTDADLTRVEAAAGRPLPASYVRFLTLVGRGAGAFLNDLTAFFPAVLALTDRHRLETPRYSVLPDDAFVFADRHGEQFLFFRLSDGPADAAVYLWTDERPRRTRKVFDSVWGFVEDELQGYEEVTGASEEL